MNNLPFIDTNIFLRFLVKDKTNPHLSQKAKTIIQQIKEGSIEVQTNICIITELVYVLEGHYQQTKASVVQKVSTLLSLQGINTPDKALVIESLHTYKDSNVDFEDAYTHTLMKDKGTKDIYTFDKKHFTRFQDLNILE